MREERRRTPRHQLGRVAAIFFGQGEEHACLVKDYSDGGVLSVHVRSAPKATDVLRCREMTRRANS